MVMMMIMVMMVMFGFPELPIVSFVVSFGGLPSRVLYIIYILICVHIYIHTCI